MYFALFPTSLFLRYLSLCFNSKYNNLFVYFCFLDSQIIKTLSQNKPNNQNNGQTPNNSKIIEQCGLINSNNAMLFKSATTISASNGISYKDTIHLLFV